MLDGLGGCNGANPDQIVPGFQHRAQGGGGFRDFVTSPISLPDNSANEGIALADFDGNGTLDLVVANGGGREDIVYSNDGVGNFTIMAMLGRIP